MKKRHTIWQLILSAHVVFLALFILYTAVIWVVLDFDPYFLQIDSCLDEGGAWDNVASKCITR
ncbi:MAG: hypothetical protein ACLFP8_06420 [Alphaproteobacteria bacterium]